MIKTRLEKVWLSRVPCFVEVNYGGGISRHNLHLRDVIAIDKAASYRTPLTARLNYVAPNHREKTNKAATRKYGDDIVPEFSMQCKRDLKMTSKSQGRLSAKYMEDGRLNLRLREKDFWKL